MCNYPDYFAIIVRETIVLEKCRSNEGLVLRYQPWNNQNPIQIFDVPGIRVDVSI